VIEGGGRERDKDRDRERIIESVNERHGN